MRGKVILCIVLLVALVGVVSADTLILYAETDGQMSRAGVSESWAEVRNGTGNEYGQTATMYAQMAANTTNTKFSRIRRTGFTFNTTDLAAWDTVNSAIVSIKGAQKSDGFGVTPSFRLVRFTPVNQLIFTMSDYNYTLWNETSIADNIAYASYSTTAYNNFTLTDLSAINKGGYTTVGVRIGGDAANSAPAWSSGASSYFGFAGMVTAGTSSDPVLTLDVTYGEPPDTTPPASITNLANVTTCQNITWSWDNPADADFALVQVYQNGTFLHNLTTPTDTDLWEDLAENTEYEFASHTCDATGNCNATWVNMTSTTGVCEVPGGDPPLASFLSNVTCGNVPFSVQFNDTSENIPTAWNWSFGTGDYSEDQNATFEYVTAGLYSINFNATNEWGTNWSNRTNYIRAVPDWAACPPTPTPVPPWTPEIMPSTEFDARASNLLGYWWIPAILLVGWILFRKW